MLDIKFIKDNFNLVKESCESRGIQFDLEDFTKLDKKRRELIKKIDGLRTEQNQIHQEINSLLKEKKDTRSKIEEVKSVSSQINILEEEFTKVKKKFNWQLLNIPNIPHTSVPKGDISSNRLVKSWGQKRHFDFKPVNHIELGEYLDIIDFKRASKICGSNFVLFKGKGAKLVRTLINFMVDLHTKKHNYKEIFPPYLVNRASMTTTGQLPKLEEDMYRLKDDDYFLIPTAEVPVTNIHRNEVLNESDLPIYYVSYTACFRREAGSYGKETKGLIRVHQFDKIELVKFTKPQNSYEESETLLIDACEVIELLEIPYRVNLLATQELSFSASKCYDIETYAPTIDKWLEVSSCSNFEDFQARRGGIKYREEGTKKLKFVHTLNGSGVALARLIISILENHQQKDGSINIPKALRPYFDGKDRIEK